MPSPTSRKMNQHAIRNHPAISPLNQIDLNTDELETLLTSIRTAVEHTVVEISNSTVIIGGVTVTFPTVDISASNGIFEFQFAGHLGHNNMTFALEVSQNNVDFHPFPVVFTIIGNNVSATFDMVFRYHRIKATNNTGGNYSVNFIESGRH